jgi:hypothetical protein
LARVSKAKGEKAEPPADLKESLGRMSLQRRLVLLHMIDWYCARHGSYRKGEASRSGMRSVLRTSLSFIPQAGGLLCCHGVSSTIKDHRINS